jgi:FtsH-binding integral membrane protein
MKKEKTNYSVNDQCCSETDMNPESMNKCSTKCRSYALWRLLAIGLAFVAAFTLGYLISPFLLRIIWLILMGTLAVLTGISMYFVISRTDPDNEDPCC